jgi:hypothetical protein
MSNTSEQHHIKSRSIFDKYCIKDHVINILQKYDNTTNTLTLTIDLTSTTDHIEDDVTTADTYTWNVYGVEYTGSEIEVVIPEVDLIIGKQRGLFVVVGIRVNGVSTKYNHRTLFIPRNIVNNEILEF